MTGHRNDQTLRYDAATQSAADALAWLVDQGGRFGHFIGGRFTAPGDGPDSHNPATGAVLASLTQAGPSDVDAAVTVARKAQAAWADLGDAGRARHLRALARTVQDNASLLSVMEVLDSGQPLRRVRHMTVPLVQRQFDYHAGLAHAMQRMCPNRAAHGVCALIIGNSAPLANLTARLAPALAAGNTVVIKPSVQTTLSALLLADLFRMAGLPDGVINILGGDKHVGHMLAQRQGVDMIAFEGPTDAGRTIRHMTAGHGKNVALELDDNPPTLVFDDADIESAVEGIIDSLTGGYTAGATRLLIQESVSEPALDALRGRMTRLRVGNPLDLNTDIGALPDPAWRDALAARMQRTGGQKFVPDMNRDDSGAFYPPILMSEVSPADPAMQDALRGPIVVADTFRTQEEAVQMANATCYARTAAIWTEDVSRTLTVAPQLVASVITVNGATMADPTVPVESLRNSGTGVIGGLAGLRAYTRRGGPDHEGPAHGAQDAQTQTSPSEALETAIKAARSAVGWRALDRTARAQTLNQIAETLLHHETEFSRHASPQEVRATADQMGTFAALAETRNTAAAPERTLTLHAPLGVVGVLYRPDATPLLSLMTALGALLMSGNCAVVAYSETGPDLRKPITEALGAAGLANGVTTLLRADLDDLAMPMASHMGIDAVWALSTPDLIQTLEHASACNFKRIFSADDTGKAEDHVQDMLSAASRIKSVRLPAMP